MLTKDIRPLTGYTDAVREVIEQNPYLPIIVSTGESDSLMGVGAYAFVTDILDLEQAIPDCWQVFTDKDYFRECLEEYLNDGSFETEEELNAAVQRELADYEPYWKKCIIVTVGN